MAAVSRRKYDVALIKPDRYIFPVFLSTLWYTGKKIERVILKRIIELFSGRRPLEIADVTRN